MSKTHYRKVFKSDHLGCADLEDLMEEKKPLIFTIKHVRQEFDTKVAGKKINANIAYFVEQVKPLVLNATNSRVLRVMTGSSFVEDWTDIKVQLYIDSNVKMKGEVVGGVRISKDRPKAKPEVVPGTEMWNRAKAAFSKDGNFNAVLPHADISEANQELIKQEASQ